MSPLAPAISTSPGAEMKQRLLHLDWLRVLAMGAIFLFHNLRVYDFTDWHIKNDVTTQAASSLVEVLNYWTMPLFFVLSSAAIYHSLRSRTPRQFVTERFLRIAVPWLGLGMFVFGPFQVYIERLSHGDAPGGFLAFLPRYFDGFYGFGGNFAWMGLHLWYLMMLFLFVLLLLPFLLPVGRSGRSLLSRLSPACRRTPVLLLLVFPLALASLLTDALGLGVTREFGSWDLFSYLLFFIYGYVLHADQLVQAAIDRLRWPMLCAALALVVLAGAMEPSGSLDWAVVRAACAWSCVLAILGFGHARLNFSNAFVKRANEAVLPFYILHQPIILAVAFFVVQMDALPVVKYLLTVAGSFVVIVAVYEYVVRRVGVLRFLFGMRPLPRAGDRLPAP